MLFCCRQKFFYLPVTTRPRQLLEHPLLFPLLQLPDRSHPSASWDVYGSDGWRQHVLEGRGRNAADAPLDPTFATENDAHNLVLSLCIDGFVPWADNMTHSITPIMLQVLNLPQHLRLRPDYMILAGIVPGPAKCKNLQPYLRFLVDELLQLYNNGLEYTNPSPSSAPSRVSNSSSPVPTIPAIRTSICSKDKVPPLAA